MTKQAAPYHFVPVHPELAILDTPVFHDIQHDDKDFWSGQLECEMTALTPLLVGHFQYNFEHLDETLKKQLNQSFGVEFVKDKKILEPLTLPGDGNSPGPVVIPGTSLKGMIRHSLSALLSAPMERVNERRFTFRPNLGKPESNVSGGC